MVGGNETRDNDATREATAPLAPMGGVQDRERVAAGAKGSIYSLLTLGDRIGVGKGAKIPDLGPCSKQNPGRREWTPPSCPALVARKWCRAAGAASGVAKPSTKYLGGTSPSLSRPLKTAARASQIRRHQQRFLGLSCNKIRNED